MGRPLKIQKYGTNQGIGGAGVPVDQGFNMWSALTNPVHPATFASTEFLGVVGGSNDISTAAFPVVQCVAFISGDSTYRNSFIVRQKGTTKYLVAAVNSIQDEDIVTGNTYYILTAGNTNWQSLGAPSNASTGDVFTATADGTGLTTTGVVYLVGTCVLVDDTTPAAGFMSINVTLGSSTAFNIQRLTNKFALDYSNPPVRYAVNFFTADGTEIKSGTQNVGNSATQQNILDLVVIDNYT